MNVLWKKIVSVFISFTLAAGLTACASNTNGTAEEKSSSELMSEAVMEDTEPGIPAPAPDIKADTKADSKEEAEPDDTIDVGVTYTVENMSPFAIDMLFVNLSAVGASFLPLISFDKDYGVTYLLAESITTEDNRTFTIKLKDDAVWSDGESVTSDDVIFTIIKFATQEVNNPNFDFSAFEGFTEDGYTPRGADNVSGIKKIDDKTLTIKAAEPMGLNTFLNAMAAWICIVPRHVLKDIPDEELLTHGFFNHPDVVSGPYKLQSFDPDEGITYVANETFFMGAPKVKNLCIHFLMPSGLYPGLRNGKLDIIPPSMANIPTEDLDRVEELPGFKAVFADPITNEMTFINTRKIPDKRVRKAMVHAIDRDRLLSSLLSGRGEITEGFVSSKSPYYDRSKERINYDPEEARRLLKEAGWDSEKELNYYVCDTDDTMVRTSFIIQQYLFEVGIKTNIQAVDVSTLMSEAGSDDMDIFSFQYTVTPNDYYIDMNDIINSDNSWTGGYRNPEVDKALKDTQNTSDEEAIKKDYSIVDHYMIEDVPMFSMYFQGTLGVVSDRLLNADPTFFGVFDNIHEWELK